MQVRELENCPHFNAGKGSVLTTNGTVEMEACIMDGNSKKCGAVSGLSTVINPISLARRVMEETPHIYLAFDGAEAFAREQVSETIFSFFFFLFLFSLYLMMSIEEKSSNHCISFLFHDSTCNGLDSIIILRSQLRYPFRSSVFRINNHFVNISKYLHHLFLCNYAS